jgi:hypothetical protein
MADSETAIVPAKEKLVKNPNGTYSTRMVGADGKFQKKLKNMPPTRELTRLGRVFLTQLAPGDKDKEGNITQQGVNRFMAMVETLYKIATHEPETGSDGAKWASASVKAFEILCKRLLGDKVLSDDEIEAFKEQSGVRIVLVQSPEFINKTPKPEIVTPTKPSFIDAEVVQQN